MKKKNKEKEKKKKKNNNRKKRRRKRRRPIGNLRPNHEDYYIPWHNVDSNTSFSVNRRPVLGDHCIYNSYTILITLHEVTSF